MGNIKRLYHIGTASKSNPYNLKDISVYAYSLREAYTKARNRLLSDVKTLKELEKIGGKSWREWKQKVDIDRDLGYGYAITDNKGNILKDRFPGSPEGRLLAKELSIKNKKLKK